MYRNTKLSKIICTDVPRNFVSYTAAQIPVSSFVNVISSCGMRGHTQSVSVTRRADVTCYLVKEKPSKCENSEN